MTKTSNNLEGSPFTPRQVRILKISIAIMTVLLIAGIMALIYGMARQASRLGAKPAAGIAGTAPYVQSLVLGQGELKAVYADHGLIVLHWKGESGDVIVTLDPQSGRELGRIQVQRQ
jgi:flagellar basal body-associated protein FliL